MSDPTPNDEALRSAQGANLGQVLLRAARLLDERALERIRALPESVDVRPAHTRLFPLIRFEGVRATVLAEQLGVTKQAITPLVQDLVSWGVVEQVPDPDDGRARLVRWTDDGRRWILEGLAALSATLDPWRAEVGEDAVALVHDALTKLVATLED